MIIVPKRLWLSALIILVSLTAISAQSFRTSMKKANTAYDIHAYNVAITEYLEALRRRADDPEALGKIADSYRQLNQMEEAAQYYAKAVQNPGVDPVYVVQYAHVLKALGRYDEAKQWYQLFAQNTDEMIGNHYAQSTDFAKSQMQVSSSYTVANEFINTSSSEFGPAFQGQDRVIFSSARTDIQRPGETFDGRAKNQLFSASIGGRGYLESPVFLDNGITGEGNEGPVSLSADGRLVAFTKNNFVDGTRQIPTSGIELSIYTGQVNPNGSWVDVRPFPHNGTDFSTGYPSLSLDGNTMFFASNRPDGYGGFDIYVSYRSGNSWTTPENLGPIINSPGNEITPYFDGTMLFFASDWHFGLGGFDSFRAQQENGRWSRIFHLGNAVNSPHDDYSFIYDNYRNLGYLVSNRLGGRGNEDIYRVSRAADNITIRVLNASDGTPVAGANVDFSRCGQGVFQTNNQGTYTFQAVQGLDCTVSVQKEGYLASSVQVATSGANTNREYEVSLSRPGEAYAGKIISFDNRAPLSGVTVVATNRQTGSVVQSQTDANGDYFLALSPYSAYYLRFSRPGYRDIEFSVNTEDGLDRSILGVISLLPSTSPQGVDMSGNPATANDPNAPGNQVRASGYAVQVAAIGSPALDRFTNLAGLGDIYYVNENGKYKIRVGVFQSREEAMEVLSIAKTNGYPGAFLLREDGYVSTEKGPGNTAAPANTAVNNNRNYGNYKVQLAAYSNPQWFDDSKIRDLGVIEDRAKGNLTVKYIGGIASLEQARQAVARARAAGFDTAFIVVDENGVLRKIE